MEEAQAGSGGQALERDWVRLNKIIHSGEGGGVKVAEEGRLEWTAINLLAAGAGRGDIDLFDGRIVIIP